LNDAQTAITGMMPVMRSVIYTAIFGIYDELNQPAAQETDCD